MSGKYDPRYGDGIPLFDRQPPLPDRRRSPSPSPRPTFHDRYSSSRTGPSYREPYAPGFRSESWRTDRPHYNRTPSPERFRDTRPAHQDLQQPWPRQTTWHNPESPQWTEKRQGQHPSYDSSAWHRPRRETIAERMFEPSDTWKQTHQGPSEYQDGTGRERSYDPPYEFNRIHERSPERAPPPDNYSYSDARYQNPSPTPTHRDIPQPSLNNTRPGSYRTQYDDRGQWVPRYSPEPPSAPPPFEGWTRDQHTPYYSRPRQPFSIRPPTRGNTSITSPQPSPTHSRIPFNERGRNDSIQSGNSDGGRPPYRTSTDTYRGSHRSRSSSRSSEFNRSRQLPTYRPKSPTPLDNHTESLASTPHGDHLMISRDQSPVPSRFNSLGEPTYKMDRRPSPSPVPSSPISHNHSQIYDQPEHTTPLELMRSPIPITSARKPSVEQQTEQTNNAMTSIESVALDRAPPTHPLDRGPLPQAAESTPEESAPGLADISQSIQTPEVETPILEVPPTEVPSTREQTMTPSMPVTPAEELRETRVVTTAIIPQTVVVPEKPPPAPAPVAMESISQALQVIVMMRLRCDRQTREERVAPALAANLALSEASSSRPPPSSSRPRVVEEVMAGGQQEARESSYEAVKASLGVRFAQRGLDLTGKVQRLKEEYLTLHDRWLLHCAKLDEVAKAGALEEAAATAGRTTRRTATLGDAVRSDLEMEQIIASLGNEELTDANHLSARNAAIIPDMITVIRGEVDYLYDDTNNLVDDPIDFYAPRTGTDDWTEDEVNIFIRKFAEHPKQFGIIADSLPDKTTAQCVTFYYLHKKKHLDFRKVVSKYATGRRGRGGRKSAKKKGNALLADILKRDAEVCREHTPATTAGRRTKPVIATSGETRRAPTIRRHNSHLEQTPATTPTPDPEPEPRRKRRRVTTARAVASLEQDAIVDEIEADARPKRGRKPRKVKAVDTAATNSPVVGNDDIAPLPTETKFIDQTELTASAKRKSQQGNVIWSDEDKAQFLVLLGQYGDDFKRIAASMPNKTTIQVNAFYKSNLVEMDLEQVAAGAPKRSPTPESAHDAWKDGAVPNSGLLTPNPGISAASSEGAPLHFPGPGLETRFRLNGRPTPPRSRLGDSSDVGQPSASTVEPPLSLRFRSTTAETMHSQRATSTEASRSLNVSSQFSPSPDVDSNPSSKDTPTSQLTTTASTTAGHINNPSPFPSAGTLTTTFPSSFPYTNLSPSHFTKGTGSGARPLSGAGTRGGGDSDRAPPAIGPTMHTFDASLSHSTPSWTHQLQTTDDLVAYLEHRTRIAGQQ